jgi:predicted metalloprotease with PDZ domain
MSDTTRDPIIAARSPLPWASWQRSEDYYSEGALVWLDVDTRIRALSGEARSLDDFARQFFGVGDAGDWRTRTYSFDDIVVCLEGLATFDWRGFFIGKLEGKHEGAPLAGVERGGYRLVYRHAPSAYWANTEKVAGNVNLTFSLGLTADTAGRIDEVLWEGPAFRAGLTAGSELLEVDGREWSVERLDQAVREGTPVALRVRSGRHERPVTIDWTGGHRYPHLEPIPGTPPRLDDILRPRR